MKSGYCHLCGHELQAVERIFRNDACPGCGGDLHCCINCSNFDTRVSDQCREPQAERVSIKDRSNFCDYFTLRQDKPETGTSGRDRASEARKKLEDLFKR
jgi:hypothetical protein